MLPPVSAGKPFVKTLKPDLSQAVERPTQRIPARVRLTRVSELFRLCRTVGERLEVAHAGDPIALLRAKGALATKAGFLVTLVSPADLDDPEKILRLRRAATELGIPL
jgi:hypothetical protein